MRHAAHRFARLAALIGFTAALSIIWSAVIDAGGALRHSSAAVDGVAVGLLLAILYAVLRPAKLEIVWRAGLTCGLAVLALVVTHVILASGINLSEQVSGIGVFDRGNVTAAGLVYLFVEKAFLALALPITITTSRVLAWR